MAVWLFLRASAFSAREKAVGYFFGSGSAELYTGIICNGRPEQLECV
jgi:hypothetical protein